MKYTKLQKWFDLNQIFGQGEGGKGAEAYKESERGRAWAGAKSSAKKTGVCSAEAYAGAVAVKDGDHEALKDSIGWIGKELHMNSKDLGN